MLLENLDLATSYSSSMESV